MPKALDQKTKLLNEVKVKLPENMVFYTFDEAAVILQCTPQTIKRWRDQGLLKTTVLGTVMKGREVVSLAQLKEYTTTGVKRATQRRRLKRKNARKRKAEREALKEQEKS